MKSLKSLLVGSSIILSSLLAPKLQAQPADAVTTPTLDYQNSVASVYATNILFNAALGGIAAWKHKEPFWDHVWKGGLSGALNTTGQLMAARNEDLVIPGKFIYNAGQSGMENLLQGKPFASRFTMDLGPLVIEYDNNLEKEKFFVGALPFPTIATLEAAVNSKRKLDWDYTFKYLTPVFVDKANNPNGLNFGIAEANIIKVNPEGLNHNTMALNLLQSWEYRSGRKIHTILIQPSEEKRKLKQKWFRHEEDKEYRVEEMKKSDFFIYSQDGKIMDPYVKKPHYIMYKRNTIFSQVEDLRRKFHVDFTFDIYDGLVNELMMIRLSGGKMYDNPLYVNHWSLINVKDK